MGVRDTNIRLRTFEVKGSTPVLALVRRLLNLIYESDTRRRLFPKYGGFLWKVLLGNLPLFDSQTRTQDD